MFSLAFKDSFRFAKRNCAAFCIIVLFFILLNAIDFGYSIQDISVSQLVDIEGMFLNLHILLGAFLWLAALVCFKIFKENKQIRLSNFIKNYRMGFRAVFTYAVSFALFIALLGILFLFLFVIDVIAEVKIYEIYNYIALESGIILLLISLYIVAYIAFKLYFALVFAFLDNDFSIVKSLKKSFSKVNYKDIIKLSIALFAYLFVVVSVGKFFTEILELIMYKQSIEYIKFGNSNLFGFLYSFIRGAVCILSCLFVTSYAWMYHEKFKS